MAEISVKLILYPKEDWHKNLSAAIAHVTVCSYTDTVEPVQVPKRPSSKIPIPCQIN